MTDTWMIVLTAVLCSVPGGVFLQHDAGPQCIFQDNGAYDCRNMSLPSVPQDIPGNVTMLYLDTNDLTVLGNDELLDKGGANIKILSIRWNVIADLEEEAFNGLTNLSIVTLWGNNITVFNKDIISGNLNMKELTLRGNPIQLPDSETEPLLNSASLTYLDLVECNLSTISEGLFSGVPNLSELYLALNKLTTVNWLSVDHLKKLTLLDFTRNEIRHVSCQAERLLPLRELYDVQSGTESLTSPFDDSTNTFYLVGNPLTCDCCLSLMTYALKKESWSVLVSCRTEGDIAGGITSPEVLKQCYVTFTEEKNRTVGDLH